MSRIDPATVSRRHVVSLGLGGGALAWGLPRPLTARGFTPTLATRMAATWRTPEGHFEAGVLHLDPRGTMRVLSRTGLPARAHAVMPETAGTLLVVARRPGEWLLRIGRDGRERQRVWVETDRVLNGHAGRSRDGRWVYTTETDLADAQGLVGVRDARSLEKVAEWRTQGKDPHALLPDAEGHWMVANGGIPTVPETGRTKRHLDRMDASLVRLHRDTGEMLGQWRLPDPRLSLRHLAWNSSGTLGVALQGEQQDAQARAECPVLAWFDGQSLQVAPQPEGAVLAGYGGDLAALGDAWMVSCPRADGVAVWRAGAWAGRVPMAGACALARSDTRLWMGGSRDVRWFDAGAMDAAPGGLDLGLAVDNHWVAI